MSEKLKRAADYDRKHVAAVREACLYLATTIGDLIDDTVIVGGLVPSLLVDQRLVRSEDERHFGTMDLDIGLALAILDDRRYQALTQRLRQAKFTQDENDEGRATSQRWRLQSKASVTVDFLINPSSPHDIPGKLRNIERDFAAVMVAGLHLAFQDRERVRLEGRTPFGELATRDVWVAGPGAFVALKALAFRNRGAHKDAYDLFYVLRHFPGGVHDIARRMKIHGEDPNTIRAVAVLNEDFAEIDSIGPRRVAEFLGGSDDALQADVRGAVLDLLSLF